MRDLRCKQKGYAITLFFYLLIAIPFSDISASEGISQVEKIEKAYKYLSDVKGRFSQMSYLKDLEKKEFYEGEFFIKIPSLFRWSYKGRSPQEVLISGERLIIYQKKEKQVFHGRFVPARYGQVPIALLGGFGNITRAFITKEEKERLILTPKEEMGNVKRIELYLIDGDFPIKRIKIIDSADNTIEIELKDVVINSGLKEDIFNFKTPKDVNVIEGF